MGLSVYRSCSWKEKREVLGTFWQTEVNPLPRINEAAIEYGPYAVLCIAVIAVEFVPVLVYAIARSDWWGWLVGAAEAFTLLSLRWSIVRNRALKRNVASGSESFASSTAGSN